MSTPDMAKLDLQKPKATVTIADVLAAMESRYPIASAELWDTVGLVTGTPDSIVHKVLFAVDPHDRVVSEAKDVGAQLVIAHHPLILNSEITPSQSKRKGEIVGQLLANKIGLFTAHTNADVAWPGVSDALAKTLGVIIENKTSIDPITSLGRIGNLPSTLTLGEFANQVLASLPETQRGIHVAGGLDKPIMRVAICGGSGGSLLDLVAQSDADVFVTSDLKYHVAQEFVDSTGKCLIDISHWAGEWTWLDQAAELLKLDLGGTLETHVSSLVTDPWSLSLN
jgi:dinuclear metal center YbgI/SA1388 family protein